MSHPKTGAPSVVQGIDPEVSTVLSLQKDQSSPGAILVYMEATPAKVATVAVAASATTDDALADTLT